MWEGRCEGQELGGLAGIVLAASVVAGNVLMHQVSSMMSVDDNREVCCMPCYYLACTFNVVLDLACALQGCP